MKGGKGTSRSRIKGNRQTGAHGAFYVRILGNRIMMPLTKKGKRNSKFKGESDENSGPLQMPSEMPA